jgi:DNA-binding transcriptional LysR family regulator
MEPSLRLFRYALAVADEGGFTRAAERLGIAQPPLSQQIARLESELGFRIFRRGRGGTAPTAPGAVFLARARIALFQADDAIVRARRAAQGEIGLLTLGLSGGAMFSFLPRLLRDFRAAQPSIALDLLNVPADEQVARLAAGTLDAGFMLKATAPREVVFERVHVEGYVAALPASHALARRKRLRLAQLAAEPFVLFPAEGSGFHAEVLALCRAAGFVPRVAQLIAPMHAVVGLVGAGLGVSVVPESVRAVSMRDVRYLPLHGLERASERFLAFRRTDRSPAADRFIDFVNARAKQARG